jgi:hypothetical protein
MSTTALGIDAPQVCATELVAHPGTLPTVTIPLVTGSPTEVDVVWRHLREPAEFFGCAMPDAEELAAALSAFSAKALVLNRMDGEWALIAAAVTIAPSDGKPRVLVTGVASPPLAPEVVRIARDDSTPPAHRSSDPWWRRMAARTTSRGELDQRERWLNGRGYADGLSDGVPILGAMVFEAAGSVVGVENPEPTSILDQLERCGVIADIERVPASPSHAERVWWLSPRYRTHPVAEIDGTRYPTDADALPSFARWS